MDWDSTARNAVVASLLFLLFPALASATNGMNMIGYGAVSSGMGGADLAIVDNASAMNINPAGICECATPELSMGLSLLMPQLNHQDNLGNDKDGEDNIFPLPFFAYVHPLGNWSLGLGLFAQGGMGAEFDNLTTPFAAQFGMMGGVPPGQVVPDTDETYSNVAFARLTPTVSYRVSPQFTVGVGLAAGYAMTEMKFFPDTSVFMDMNGDMMIDPAAGEMAFFGMDMKDMDSYGFAGRVGFQYRVGNLTIGGTYISETELDFDGGTLKVDMSSIGLGKVEYDAEMNGFTWPQQAGLGVSYRFAPWLLIAGDVDWVNWSDAIEKITIKTSNPDNPMAPSSLPEKPTFVMDWNDQWVFAVGVELTPITDWAFRFGYNHGNSPVPDNTLTPLFPAIIEDHVTAGAGVTLGKWTLDCALEYALEAKQTNDNPDGSINPFGPGSQESHSQWTTHLMARRVF